MSEQEHFSFLADTQPASRACVFINSINNSVMQKVTTNSQLFALPFPPTINPRDLIVPRPNGHVPRPPNTFIIYRKLFFETARTFGYNLPMNIISSMASKSWDNESDNVKKEYKRIAKEAFSYYNELFPKIKSPKKSNKWRTVSFDKSTQILSTQFFDSSIKVDQQTIWNFIDNTNNNSLFIDDRQYEFGDSYFSNYISETNSFGMFDTQSNFINSNNFNEMSDEQLPSSYNLSDSTKYHDNLNDSLISYE
ncbi:835_t:CDS:2, partial [Scutellospora calospora]